MKTKRMLSGWLQQWVFIGPALIFFSVVVLIPFLMSIYYSFTEWNGVTTKVTFNGLDNFKQILFHDKDYRNAFSFTSRLTVTNVILTNLVGFLLALLLTQALKTRNVLRTIFFMPNVIGGLLLGFIWQFIFVKGFATLGNLTHIGFFELPWLGDCTDSFLGDCHRQCVAGCWISHDYLYCGLIERAEGYARSSVYRWRITLASTAKHHRSTHYASSHSLLVPDDFVVIQNL